MTVNIDINVLNSIITSYRTLPENQTRAYGLILGTQKGETYYITDAISGFVAEDPKDGFTRMNNKNFECLLNAYHQKVNLQSSKSQKNDKNAEFLKLENLVILGGFCTGNDIFPELHRLISSISQIKDEKIIKIYYDLFLLVDVNNSNKSTLNYGIKTYKVKWDLINFKNDDNNSMSFLKFKEIDCKIVKFIHDITRLNQKGCELFNFEENLKSIEDKQFQKKMENFNKFLNELEENDKVDDDSYQENIKFLTKNLNTVVNYLKDMKDYVDSVISNIKDDDDGIDDDIIDKIEEVANNMKLLIDQEKIIKLIEKERKQNDVIVALANVLEIQMDLAKKINQVYLK